MMKSVIPLSSIIALRFLGLFLVLPVLSAYALNLKGATNEVVGIVVGGYALTQMLFQVPFGIMSDKLGRKGTIVTGLLLFAIGSYFCAISDDIYTLMFGRFLQGAGAIGAVVTAMISDIVKEEQRPKAMALMGGSIAISFAVSMLAGPTISAYAGGVSTLFYITMFLALGSIIILFKAVPESPRITHTYNKKANLKQIFSNSNLIKMNITNFLQKGLMTFAFMIIPIVLIHQFNWDIKELWKVYLPAMILGVASMGPAAVMAEKKGKFKEILIIGITFFAISYLIIGNSSSSFTFVIGVMIFFAGFNMHEPIMQSLASKFAKVHQRGLMLGIFNACGYLGTFCGGLIGGIFYEDVSLSKLVIAIAIVCVIWIILIITMPNPAKRRTAYLSLDKYKRDNTQKLHDIAHIDEWYINESENIIVVKYDSHLIDEDGVKNLLK
ncbi:MFS transporter [Malaciobacter molluscorum]|uniref:MFS transporter n=1 Tax=Malaciobacter molluscorum TaxID=1032072 RepID=UPI00100A3DF5|nr:MFS transporter [Malaciobacter molluscorum]RXJ94609.1 MFS transporter [Malaciobacter molluscorum]